MDVFRSETAEYSNVASGSVGNQNSFPDLVHVFDKQFRQWRDKSENAARECRSDERATGFMIGNMRLYDQYARLVVHSFGLQRAMDVLPMDLPAAFAEVSEAYRSITNVAVSRLCHPVDQLLRDRLRRSRTHSRLSRFRLHRAHLCRCLAFESHPIPILTSRARPECYLAHRPQGGRYASSSRYGIRSSPCVPVRLSIPPHRCENA